MSNAFKSISSFIEYVKYIPKYKKFLKEKDSFDMWFDASEVLFLYAKMAEELEAVKLENIRLQNDNVYVSQKNWSDSKAKEAIKKINSILYFPSKPIHSNMPGYFDLIQAKSRVK